METVTKSGMLYPNNSKIRTYIKEMYYMVLIKSLNHINKAQKTPNLKFSKNFN